MVGDLLGVVYALWLLGWVVGPVWAGAPVLRAEHFALLPVPRLRLATGLLGAAFAGITTLVTLLAFTSLVIFAARLGVAAVLIAVPAMILQLALVVLLSRVAAAGFGSASKGRTGAALIGLMVAGLLVLSQSGWMVFVAIQSWGMLSTGPPPVLVTLTRALPSGWGLTAVESAARSDWLPAAGALAWPGRRDRGLAAGLGLDAGRAANRADDGTREPPRQAAPYWPAGRTSQRSGREGVAHLVARPAADADHLRGAGLGARHGLAAAHVRREGAAALGGPGRGPRWRMLLRQPVWPGRHGAMARAGDPAGRAPRCARQAVWHSYWSSGR